MFDYIFVQASNIILDEQPISSLSTYDLFYHAIIQKLTKKIKMDKNIQYAIVLVLDVLRLIFFSIKQNPQGLRVSPL